MLAVLLAADTVAFFRMHVRFHFCVFPGDSLFNFFFPPVVFVRIGETLNDKLGIELFACSSSMGVDISCCWVFPGGLVSLFVAFRLRDCWMLGCPCCAGFFELWPIWDVFVSCAFSAKQNFSILRLFRLYSPIVCRLRNLLGGVLVLVVKGVFLMIWLCHCYVSWCFYDYECLW